jgi:hypothetical protein
MQQRAHETRGSCNGLRPRGREKSEGIVHDDAVAVAEMRDHSDGLRPRGRAETEGLDAADSLLESAVIVSG